MTRRRELDDMDLHFLELAEALKLEMSEFDVDDLRDVHQSVHSLAYPLARSQVLPILRHLVAAKKLAKRWETAEERGREVRGLRLLYRVVESKEPKPPIRRRTPLRRKD